MSEIDGDWEVACSDDDNYGFTKDGDEWLPSNEVRLFLYFYIQCIFICSVFIYFVDNLTFLICV